MSKQMDAGAAKTRPGRAGTLFGVLAALCLAWLCLTSARAQDAQAGPVRPGHVAVELVPSFAVIAPGQGRVLIALRQEIDPGWHTYWKNPGDSGEPTRLDWTLPPGVSAGGILWPAPEPIPVGPLLNHGYKDSVTLLVPLEIGAGLSPGETVRLEAFATWLVCEEICIPEEARLALELPVAAEPVPHPYWGPRLAEAEAALPAPSPWAAGYALAGERLRVWVGAPELAASLSARAVETLHLFPEADGFLAYAAPQSVRLGPEGITIEAQAGYKAGELAAAGAPLPALLTFTDALAGAGPVRHAFDLVAGPAPVPAQMAERAAPGPLGAGGGAPRPAFSSLWAVLGFAFLGGLILNLMPCVFPVLFLKGLSLVSHAEDAAGRRALQGLVFTLGVLTTFLAIALALLAFRAGGAAIGWGFQLQSAPLVAALALLVFAVGLNLSGVFGIGGAFAGAGESLTRGGGLRPSFFTGVLAVLVATPCTAPFMAAALGYALTAPRLEAVAVFLALGLGLAAPFLALSLTPGLARLLPRPGAWMETLKKVLAFPMYATAAWLVWVLSQQTNETGLALVLAAALVLAFALWLIGRPSTGRAGRLVCGFLVLLALALLVLLPARDGTPGRAGFSPESAGAGPPFEAWSPERQAEALGEGRVVFVNFTAAWCITCLVNERVALARPAVAEAFAAGNVLYLKGDWTNRDGAITEALAAFGRAGVPLYVFYPADGTGPVVLPQVLTERTVIDMLASGR